MNAFDLLAQFLIGSVRAPAVLGVEFVVIAAGGELRYLAGFRN